MFNFFKDMKQKLDSTLQSSPPQPVYRQYTHAELKIIAMRTRMIFQQLYKKQRQRITQKDSQFKKLQSTQSPLTQQYKVLQQIGKKVIQTQSIKLYIQFLRKIQSYSPQIITKKGDISLLKHQIKWFQCILWYRKCRNLTTIEQFNTFCYNFFKGIDVTQQLNVKCELFNIQYEQLKYLQQDEIMPIQYLVNKVVPFVSFQIQQKQLQEIRVINKQQIKQKQQKQRQQEQKERRKIFGQGANNSINSSNNNSNSNNSATTVTNPFDIINQRMAGNNNVNNNNQPNNYNYNQPQQQQYYNPNINPNINPNFNPYQNINNNNNNNHNNIQTSQLPFLPKQQQKHNIKPIDNDEFAIDRFSRNYYNQQPIIQPALVNRPQQKVSISSSQQKQKSFRSSQLNLINWEAMYGSGDNKSNTNNKPQQQQQQPNPYINSSKIGLLNNPNFQQYISSSSNNEYDAYSLPYPPSGVIPMSEIKYQPDHKFFVDTLDKYQSQPAIGQQCDDGMKRIKDQNDGESFIKSIEGEFFGGVGKRGDNQNNNNRDGQLQLSEQQLLLKQIQEANKNRQQEQNIMTINESSPPKSFNRLFGHKFKSNLQQAQNQNQKISPQQPSLSEQKLFPNLNLIQFVQSKLPVDNINSNDNDNINDRNKQPQQQSIIKRIQQDQIQEYLNQHHYYNNNNNNNNNNIENDYNLDKQLDALHINNSSNYQSNDYNNDEEHIDDDISKLINTHKQDIQHQLQSYRHEQNQQQQQPQHKQQQPTRYQKQNYSNHNTHNTYQIDNQRIDSSTLQRHSQPQHAQSQYHQHTEQYTTIETDLIDSLNIIRRHFGQEFVTTANYCKNILQSQEVDNNMQSQEVDNNNILQQQQQISPSKQGIKKPYMVSIYARQDYLDSVKQPNTNNNQ